MIFQKIFTKVSRLFKKNMDGNGERVDIIYKLNPEFEKFDIYQKSHYKRYEFATNIITPGSVCGDFACGTGYGSVMLAQKAQYVIGADINAEMIKEIKTRYENVQNVEFIVADLLQLSYSSIFDFIISFETIEHFSENDIIKLLRNYKQAMKPNGRLMFSTPYMQEHGPAAQKLGFHKTFEINETKITNWLLATNLKPEYFKYQNYKMHIIQDELSIKDFIICIASQK